MLITRVDLRWTTSDSYSSLGLASSLICLKRVLLSHLEDFLTQAWFPFTFWRQCVNLLYAVIVTF